MVSSAKASARTSAIGSARESAIGSAKTLRSEVLRGFHGRETICDNVGETIGVRVGETALVRSAKASRIRERRQRFRIGVDCPSRLS